MSQTINVNITPGGPTPIIHVSQKDVGRRIVINMTDGSEWFDLTGATVKLQGTKPSGFGYSVAGTVSGHTVTIVTTKEMTDEAGNIASELRVEKGSDDIGSKNCILSVERDPHEDGTTDGSREAVINELSALVERVKEVESAEETLQNAEAWAVGQRGGEDVDEDDETYQNNSKYYAAQAGLSEAAAADSEAKAKGSEVASASSASNANANMIAAQTAQAAAQAASADAKAAAQDAKSAFAYEGKVQFAIDEEDNGVNEYWTITE